MTEIDIITDDDLRKALRYRAGLVETTPTDAYVMMKAEQRLAATTSNAAETAKPVAFQERVAPWMQACFGPEISNDRLERGDRHLEEVLELLQSGDYPRERVAALTNYVYDRPKGEPHQEVGGVMVTLAAYCLAHNLDMHKAAEDELARIWTKVEKIRAKQAGKPVGSALPVAAPPPLSTSSGEDRAAGLDELLQKMQRFDTPVYDDIGMQERADGEWVRVDDLAAALKALHHG